MPLGNVLQNKIAKLKEIFGCQRLHFSEDEPEFIVLCKTNFRTNQQYISKIV